MNMLHHVLVPVAELRHDPVSILQVAQFAEDLSLEELEVETTGCLGASSNSCWLPLNFRESVRLQCSLVDSQGVCQPA